MVMFGTPNWEAAEVPSNGQLLDDWADALHLDDKRVIINSGNAIARVLRHAENDRADALRHLREMREELERLQKVEACAKKLVLAYKLCTADEVLKSEAELTAMFTDAENGLIAEVAMKGDAP
jgi:hypothetical protein